MDFPGFYKKLVVAVFNFSCLLPLRTKKKKSDQGGSSPHEAHTHSEVRPESVFLQHMRDFKKALKAKEDFRKQLKKRSQEFLIHIRELMEISNKMTHPSRELAVDSFEIRMIHSHIEEALKQLEQGCPPLKISHFNLHDLIEETIILFSLEILEKNVCITRPSKGKQIFIESDALLSKQLLAHFFTIGIERLPKQGRIEIDLSATKEKAKIRLKDNGYFLDNGLRDILWGERESFFLKDCFFNTLIRELQGEVSFSYNSKEEFEVTLHLPLKYEENERASLL